MDLKIFPFTTKFLKWILYTCLTHHSFHESVQVTWRTAVPVPNYTVPVKEIFILANKWVTYTFCWNVYKIYVFSSQWLCLHTTFKYKLQGRYRQGRMQQNYWEREGNHISLSWSFQVLSSVLSTGLTLLWVTNITTWQRKSLTKGNPAHIRYADRHMETKKEETEHFHLFQHLQGRE